MTKFHFLDYTLLSLTYNWQGSLFVHNHCCYAFLHTGMLIHGRFKQKQRLTLLHLFIFQINVAASNHLLLDWDVEFMSILVSFTTEQNVLFCHPEVKSKLERYSSHSMIEVCYGCILKSYCMLRFEFTCSKFVFHIVSMCNCIMQQFRENVL